MAGNKPLVSEISTTSYQQVPDPGSLRPRNPTYFCWELQPLLICLVFEEQHPLGFIYSQIIDRLASAKLRIVLV